MSAYAVIVWNNAGERQEHPMPSLLTALDAARGYRTLLNRTVKVGHCGNTVRHWVRSNPRAHWARNHWTRRATSDEWFQ